MGTALHGGNLGQNLLTSLRSAAADTLGEKAAGKIGAAYEDGKIDKAVQLIAHAALGGTMAAADGKDAASGAIGGVVGEIAGDLFVEKWLGSKLSDPDSMRLQTKEDADKLKAETASLKARGVDVAKLTAGMAAAVAGLDVNAAAHTGGNAAENNALPLIILGGMIALELIDKGIQTYNAWQFAKAVQAGDSAKATEYGTELALSLGTDAITGNAAFIKMLNSFGLVALSTKIGQKVEKVAVESWRIADKTLAKTGFNEVADFIAKNGKLPGNYVSKSEATALGWSPKKANLNDVMPGKSIGGDIFNNNAVNGVRPLPDAPGRIWREADINYSGGYRGAERIIFSSDGLIYKTSDHYKTMKRIK